MIDSNSIILVTGGTSGIGKETVKGLARIGAQVVFTARDEKKGAEVQKEIINETGNANIAYLICDLSSLSSVKACGQEFQRRWKRLDVLIHNAGVMPIQREESKDGFELNFAVNVLAPVLLTYLLLPLLKASAPARIITVSSTMHTQGVIDFDDLESKKQFNRYAAYAQSKLALLLFTNKIAEDFKGSGITVNALHPGAVATDMTLQSIRSMNPLLKFIYKKTLRTPAQGAKTSIYLATSPDVASITGKYFTDCTLAQTAPGAQDLATARRLCTLIETTYLAPYLL